MSLRQQNWVIKRTTDFNKDRQLFVRGTLKASQETWVFRVRQGNQIKILRNKGAS